MLFFVLTIFSASLARKQYQVEFDFNETNLIDIQDAKKCEFVVSTAKNLSEVNECVKEAMKNLNEVSEFFLFFKEISNNICFEFEKLDDFTCGVIESDLFELQKMRFLIFYIENSKREKKFICVNREEIIFN